MSKHSSFRHNEGFSSSLGAILALVGSAVGLGNLWRFPYLMGTNGGSAFILIYIAFVAMLSVPIMIAEFTIGRHSRANCFRAMKVIVPGSKWGNIGILYVVSCLCLLSFYPVVGGWTVDYLFRAISFDLPVTGEAAESFSLATNSTFRPLIFTFIFGVATALVLLFGVKGGIEKSTKTMMPILFLFILVLSIKSISLKGSSAGIDFLLKPDFSKVTFKTLLAAMGQAFFSLSLGVGAILTYASYSKKDDNVVFIASKTAFADILFALLAGLAIMPAVFALGMSPSEGPGLLFIVLPEIFNQISGGSIFAILFFVTVFLAAISSSFSMLEVIVTYLSEEFQMKRKKAILLSTCVFMVLSMLCSLSMGPLKDFKILGYDLFSLFDAVTANFLTPIGAILIVVFLAWRMPKKDVFEEFSGSGKSYKTLYEIIYFIIKYVAPCTIAIIMICGWLGI